MILVFDNLIMLAFVFYHSMIYYIQNIENMLVLGDANTTAGFKKISLDAEKTNNIGILLKKTIENGSLKKILENLTESIQIIHRLPQSKSPTNFL